MLRVEHEKWNQSTFDLRHEAVHAEHPRTRERFLALVAIAAGDTNATLWAAANGRHFQSVQAWVNGYNEHGPSCLVFQHTGGRTPLFLRKIAP